MTATAKSALDATEKALVEQSKKLDGFTHRELTELARLLRRRRERVLRMIRDRNRVARKSGKANPDKGAHDKKDLLVEAIERVNDALEAGNHENRPRGGDAPSKPAAKAKPAAKPKAAAKPAETKVKEEAAEPAKKAAPKAAAKKDAEDAPAKKPAAKPAAKKPAAAKSTAKKAD